jgi:hypothetical protein
MPRYLFIVARGRPEIYAELWQQFEGNPASRNVGARSGGGSEAKAVTSAASEAIRASPH